MHQRHHCCFIFAFLGFFCLAVAAANLNQWATNFTHLPLRMHSSLQPGTGRLEIMGVVGYNWSSLCQLHATVLQLLPVGFKLQSVHSSFLPLRAYVAANWRAGPPPLSTRGSLDIGPTKRCLPRDPQLTCWVSFWLWNLHCVRVCLWEWLCVHEHQLPF